MRDLEKCVRECMQELSSIGITCGNITRLEVNSRAIRRWGQCTTIVYDKQWEKRQYEISISVVLLDERNPESALKDTVIHELLHSCKNCNGHKGEWKRLAEKVNRELGYNIKRCTSPEEKGIKFNTLPKTKGGAAPKYFVECSHCGLVYSRTKKTKVIQHPENYRCGRCGGKLRHIS